MRISDWSSDVCSSDLVGTEDPDGPVEDLDGLVEAELDGIGHGREELIAGGHRRQQGCVSHGGAGSAGEGRSGGHETQPDGNEHPTARPARTAERRVGKRGVRPCRTRWAPEPEKKNNS